MILNNGYYKSWLDYIGKRFVSMFVRWSSRKAWLLTTTLVNHFPFSFPSYKKELWRKGDSISKNRDQKVMPFCSIFWDEPLCNFTSLGQKMLTLSIKTSFNFQNHFQRLKKKIIFIIFFVVPRLFSWLYAETINNCV